MDIYAAINHANNSSEMRIHEATFLSMSKQDENIILIDSINLTKPEESSLFIGASCDPLFREFCRNNNVSSFISLVDINSFSEINELIRYHNGIIVQTPRHKKLIELMTDLPVILIHEEMDPLYINKTKLNEHGLNNDKSISWFGYGINFNKSLTHLVPVIKRALSENLVSDFKIHCRRTRGFDIDPLFQFVSFDERNIRVSLSVSNYCLLSHVPLDLHINTIIKSPNKLISAINSGVIPICSHTPSYSEFMNLLGLDEFIFTSPKELYKIFAKLDPINDRKKLIAAQEKLQIINEQQVAQNIITIKSIEDVHDRPVTIDKKSVDHINNFETMSVSDALGQLMIVLEIEFRRIPNALARHIKKLIPFR